MKMPFNEEKAIDEAIEIIDNLTKFYQNMTQQHRAALKAADLFYITVNDGWVYLEYNHKNKQRAIEGVCNVKHCHKTEEEIREQIALFFDNL